jgi:nucleoside-diphosphate-sugar epimerase
MKILMTGAAGVIGRRLVPLLFQAGHDVAAAARSPNGRADVERHGATAVDVDLFDLQSVGRAVAGRDAVIDLATHMPESSVQMLLPWAWRENDRIRRIASRTLVEASLAGKVSRFVQESFAPVYPDCGDRWIDEGTPIRPVRYNRTIADAEAAADHFSRRGRIGVVLRFGSFYGPDARHLRDLITWVRKGWAPLPGPANAYISPVSHDDAAAAAAAAITLAPGIYNVVDDEPVTHKAFVDSLADAIGVAHPKLPPPWVTTLFGSAGEVVARLVRISNKKLRASSTWMPGSPSVFQGWPAAVAALSQRSAEEVQARTS